MAHILPAYGPHSAYEYRSPGHVIRTLSPNKYAHQPCPTARLSETWSIIFSLLPFQGGQLLSQESALCRHALDLHITPQGQSQNTHTGPRRKRLGETLGITLVHAREIIHRSEINVDLDDSLQRGIGRFKDSRHILNRLDLFPAESDTCLLFQVCLIGRRFRTVLSATVPSTNLFVRGSRPRLPEQ